MRTSWLIAALFSAVALAALHWFATDDFWYWRYPWFDIPMHYLGGLTIGIFLIALLRTSRPIAFLLLMVGVAIGWEVFEYIFGIPRESNYAMDTIIDLFMDTLGAVTAYVFARRTIWRLVP